MRCRGAVRRSGAGIGMAAGAVFLVVFHLYIAAAVACVLPRGTATFVHACNDLFFFACSCPLYSSLSMIPILRLGR